MQHEETLINVEPIPQQPRFCDTPWPGLQQGPQEQAEAQPPLWTPHHAHRIPKGHDQSVMWLHLIQADHPGAAHSLQGQVCPQDHQE